ncbi:MAG: rRNA pseudouridine synthase [Flavobacteriales bacterium]|nr:rRNA pseudouridine synthase [Flavobacteriales bacterium]
MKKQGRSTRENKGKKRVPSDLKTKFSETRSKDGKTRQVSFKKKKRVVVSKHTDGLVRLNKFIANAGVCSRREADTLIESGSVKVDGKVVTQLGTRIDPNSKVTVGDESLRTEKMVYLLLNKPKNYITTSKDPSNRRTVMHLVEGACKERIYPVGRLDRNTTGLLLFTNDGELANKLMHPKRGIKKLYHATLDKNIKQTELNKLVEGLKLEDGFASADEVSFVGASKDQVGVVMHMGKNRIVRRMFEHLGFNVIKLDRVLFAGLNKKDVPRGKHRFLTEKEVNFLKMQV